MPCHYRDVNRIFRCRCLRNSSSHLNWKTNVGLHLYPIVVHKNERWWTCTTSTMQSDSLIRGMIGIHIRIKRSSHYYYFRDLSYTALQNKERALHTPKHRKPWNPSFNDFVIIYIDIRTGATPFLEGREWWGQRNTWKTVARNIGFIETIGVIVPIKSISLSHRLHRSEVINAAK